MKIIILGLALATTSFAQKLSPTPVPKIFAEGIVSVDGYESHADFSVGGDTVMFVRSSPNVTNWTICYSIRKNGNWSKPEVASFSGQYLDADPFFTADGKTLYFISNRPAKPGVEKTDMDIWKIEKKNNKWGEPQKLSDVINSEVSEYYPTLAANGTMYFGSRRAGGKGNSDIYKSVLVNGEYTKPVNVGNGINTEGSEFEPYISPDESYMIFMAATPDDLAYADLFISYNKNGVWTKAEKLSEPFNSPVTEFSPKVTKDGKYFFFASARKNGLCDIYFVDVSGLKINH